MEYSQPLIVQKPQRSFVIALTATRALDEVERTKKSPPGIQYPCNDVLFPRNLASCLSVTNRLFCHRGTIRPDPVPG